MKQMKKKKKNNTFSPFSNDNQLKMKEILEGASNQLSISDIFTDI
jgi:hypothetical protein